MEKANDLRDQRDAALDELSGYIDIDYYEEKNGEIVISAETAPFVTMGGVYEMGIRYVPDSSLVIPTWPAYERDVFAEGQEFTNVADTDKGELKGLIAARGTVEVDYTDIPVMPDSTDYDLTTAEGLDAYNKAYDAYKTKQEYYNKYIEPSVILSALSGIDKLVNGIVESINNVLCPEKQVETTTAYKDANGNEIQADKYVYKASSHEKMYDRFGKEVAGIDNGDGTYSYTSEEKLYTDASLATEENVDTYTYSILDMDKTDYGME